jgi:hypothetical protein
MRRKYILTAYNLLWFISSAFAQLKVDVPHFISLYNQHKYKEVFDEATELRNVKEYGKMAVLDYFIAKALCAQGYYKYSEDGYQYILDQYPLSEKQQIFILDQKSKCQQAELESLKDQQFLAVDFKMVNQASIPIALVRGKLGYVLDCQSDTEAYKFSPDFDREELEKRLFLIDEKAKAVTYYKNFLGSGYNVDESGRYIFITEKPYSLSSDNVKMVATRLENAYKFIHDFYGIRPPDKLIAVYLMRDKETLRATAVRVHGLTLPASNIGYSSLNDLSILGNSDAQNIGTLYHELFHLMIRTDLGDIPAWLDEGIACLYETSTWTGAVLKGNIVNWRTEVLWNAMKARQQVPQLSQLFMNNWQGFLLGEKNTPCAIAIDYAMAKHFAIYMQDRGLLQKMVTAFKNRKNVFTDTLAPQETNMMLVESATGMTSDILQKSFDAWFDATYHREIGFSSQDLEHSCMMVSYVLEVYRSVDRYKPLSELQEYKNLMNLYAEIEKSLADLHSKKNSEHQVAQTSLDIIIPDDLKTKMNKFLIDGGNFEKAHPLH